MATWISQRKGVLIALAAMAFAVGVLHSLIVGSWQAIDDERRTVKVAPPKAKPAPLIVMPEPTPGTLTIAALSLAEIEPALDGGGMVAARARATAADDDDQAWRTTFGSERRDVVRRKAGPTGITADLVAVQGVATVQDIAGSFGARDYFPILSRQLLLNKAAGAEAASRTSTGVLVRRREGLRVTLQEHLLLKRPALGGAGAAAEPDAAERPGSVSGVSDGDEVAAVATRISHEAGAQIWLVSVDFSRDCFDWMSSPAGEGGGFVCELHRARLAELGAWIAARKDDATLFVVAGPLVDHLKSVLGDGLVAADVAVGSGEAKCTRAAPRAVVIRDRSARAPAHLSARLWPRGANQACALIVELKR